MTNQNKWFTPISTLEETCILFCFPYAGGGATTYYSWKKYFKNTNISLCPVRLPGRESRLSELPYRRMSHLIEDLTEVIHPYIQQPFAFFGHSMGALISYELTKSIYERYQVLPNHLFLSARYSPHLRKTPTNKYLLPDNELLEEIRKLGGTKEEILKNRGLVEMILPIIRSDFELIETYEYISSDPLSVNTTILGSIKDELVNIEELLAWKKLFTGSTFSVRLFEGNHFYHENYAERISSIIKNELKHIGQFLEMV